MLFTWNTTRRETLSVRYLAHNWSCFWARISDGTFMIWSPVRRPSCSAALSSWTPATKMPTSFPPASLRPTLSPFLKRTITVLGLHHVGDSSSEFFIWSLPEHLRHLWKYWPVNFLVLRARLQRRLRRSVNLRGHGWRCTNRKESLGVYSRFLHLLKFTGRYTFTWWRLRSMLLPLGVFGSIWTSERCWHGAHFCQPAGWVLSAHNKNLNVICHHCLYRSLMNQQNPQQHKNVSIKLDSFRLWHQLKNLTGAKHNHFIHPSLACKTTFSR